MLPETSSRSSQPITQENAWVPVFWEPVAGTGERLMVGVIVQFDNIFSAHRIIRDDVLSSLYGKTAGRPEKLLDFALNDLRTIAEFRGLDALPKENSMGLTCLRVRRTSPANVQEALRTAATMFSSMANLDIVDDEEDSDTPDQEEQVKHWTVGVRERVLANRPELAKSFNQAVRFYPDGELVRFGFINDAAVIHFGVLRPVQQSSSLRDARARLWELARAQESAGRRHAALLLAIPRSDDPTLGDKQRQAAERNQREIEREASEVNINLYPVISVEAGASAVLELAT